MTNNPDLLTQNAPDEDPDELLMLELDERLEFSMAMISSELNGGCNASKCTQNGSCFSPS